MPSYFDIVENSKRYFGFSQDELKWIIISIFAMGFIVGFDDGSSSFVLAGWIKNYVVVTILVAIALLAHLCVQRVFGIYLGFRVEHKFWLYGIMAGVLIAVMTNGWVAFIACSGIFLHTLEIQRLGKFRYWISMWANGWIALIGPITNLGLALLFKIAAVFLPFAFLEKAIVINVLFAIGNMLPIPPLDGLNTFFASPFLYFMSFGLVIGFGLALIFLPVAFAIIAAVITSIAFGAAYSLFIINHI